MTKALIDQLNALRDRHRKKMNDASDAAQLAASDGDMEECSKSSIESERHREAFLALNTAISLVEAMVTA